jgi:ABC-type phosphate/phosphonate transport system substrate-binding protein
MSIASLPMYDMPEAAEATEALWRGLARHFTEAGIEDVPAAILRRPRLPEHWLAPDLLFSQTCGYPFRNAIKGRVRILATPCYDAAGAEGPNYRSIVLVRANAREQSLAELKGATVAFNSTDSQSGYNALRFLVAPLATGGRFFGKTVETGGHGLSLAAVAAGEADVAAVDCVSYALFQRYRRLQLAKVRVLCSTPSAPGLPYVTAGDGDPARLSKLRDGLRAAMADPALAAAREALLLRDVMLLPDSAYERMDEMEAAAVARGYPALG